MAYKYKTTFVVALKKKIRSVNKNQTPMAVELPKVLRSQPPIRFAVVAVITVVALFITILLVNKESSWHRTQLERSTYTKVTYSHEGPTSEVLVLTALHENTTFGKPELKKYVNLIELTGGRHKVAVGVLCNTEDEFIRLDRYFRKHEPPHFHKVTLVYAPITTKKTLSDFNPSVAEEELLREQKRTHAIAMNMLMYLAMDEEPYVLFLDQRIETFEVAKPLDHFISSGKDIVVARVVDNDIISADVNLWKGSRRRPKQHVFNMMDGNYWLEFEFTPGMDGDDHGLAQSLESDFVPLDSVGSMALFVKSWILKQGVVMMPMNIIGTHWPRYEGFDGLGPLAICYVAKQLGYLCWGMPKLVARLPRNFK